MIHSEPTTATAILSRAAEIVGGARNTTHGEKERSFTATAALWQAYVEGRRTPGPLTARDVAQMLALLKIARSIQGEPIGDHFLDQAGYSAIAGEIAAGERAAEAAYADAEAALSSVTRPTPVHPGQPGDTLWRRVKGNCAAFKVGLVYSGLESGSYLCVTDSDGDRVCGIRENFVPVVA